jgi:SET domain-containing protein
MVRIGNSPIDGQGLFAAQDIAKGTRIIAYVGEKITRRESARRLEAGNAYIFHMSSSITRTILATVAQRIVVDISSIDSTGNSLT